MKKGREKRGKCKGKRRKDQRQRGNLCIFRFFEGTCGRSKIKPKRAHEEQILVHHRKGKYMGFGPIDTVEPWIFYSEGCIHIPASTVHLTTTRGKAGGGDLWRIFFFLLGGGGIKRGNEKRKCIRKKGRKGNEKRKCIRKRRKEGERKKKMYKKKKEGKT